MSHQAQHKKIQEQALSLIEDMGLTLIPICSHDHEDMDDIHISRCKTAGKTPIFKGWSNSVLAERRFPSLIDMKKIFRRTPHVNIGLVLGKTPNYNIVGVDVDGEEGLKKWDELVADRNIPITWEFYTGGNGYRLLFALPPELDTKKQKITLDGKHQEIAFICQGQQTVLPPSIHPSGLDYQWVQGRSPWDVPLAPCPDWIIERIVADKTIDNKKSPTVIINPDKKLTEGGRSDELTKQLGSLVRKNYAVGHDAVRQLCLVYANEKCSPPLPEGEVIKMFEWLWEKETQAQEKRKEKEQNKELFTEANLGREFILAQQEAGIEFRYRNDEHTFMYATMKRGPWRPISEKRLTDMMLVALQQRFHTNTINVNKIKKVIEELKSLLITDVEIGHPEFNKDDAKDNPFTKAYNNEDEIAVSNGIIRIDTGEILPWNPNKYYHTVGFDVLYSAEKVEACKPELERWKELVHQWITDEEAEKFLQEYVGYCLTPSCARRAMVLLEGAGSNGKSMFLDIIVHLFGDLANTFSLSRFENAFYGADIKDRRLLYDPDMDIEYVKHTGKLKSLVSGEPVQYNQKFERTYSFYPTAKIIMNTNTLPRMADNSYGMSDRIYIVKFPHRFEKNVEFVRSLNIYKKPKGRLAILVWALEGLRRLNENGKFSNSSNMQRAKEEYLLSNDPIQNFLNDCCVTVDPTWTIDGQLVSQKDTSIPHQDLYNRYAEWAKDCGERVKSKSQFDALLRAKGFQKRSVYQKKATKGGLTVRSNVVCWMNIMFSDSVTYSKIMHENEKK